LRYEQGRVVLLSRPAKTTREMLFSLSSPSIEPFR
jgi:hypothetical protein